MRQSPSKPISPIVGVIVMVMITVILATIMTAHIIGMTNRVYETRYVGVTATTEGNTLFISYWGGKDDYRVQSINVTLYSNGTSFCLTDSELSTINCNKPSVGTRIAISAPPANIWSNIMVIARFTDGQSQVVLDTYVISENTQYIGTNIKTLHDEGQGPRVIDYT